MRLCRTKAFSQGSFPVMFRAGEAWGLRRNQRVACGTGLWRPVRLEAAWRRGRAAEGIVCEAVLRIRRRAAVMDPVGAMFSLPVEEGALVLALAGHLREARAGVLYADDHEDSDSLAAALDAASLRLGIPIRREWLGHRRDALAWLRADDERLKAQPDLAIMGVLL